MCAYKVYRLVSRCGVL